VTPVALGGAVALAPRPVGIGAFVRLKLRILGNGMRGQNRRIVAFVAGAVIGFFLAAAGFLFFLTTGAIRSDLGFVLTAFGGGAVVLGWLLLPLLFFGVDETLDPARFALLPLTRRTLATGMLAAALVGIPGAATALALLGAVLAGGVRAGLGGALVALLGVALTVLLCVVLSRALTSAFAGLLRSRRVRDLAAIVIALIAASVGPVQLAITSLATHASLAPTLRVARVLGWTPLAAGLITPYDVAAGRPLLAIGRLAIVAASVLLLLWWWSRTLESAMLGASSAGPAGAKAMRGGAVQALLPRLIRVGRPGQYTAIVARELRYWSRDPRRRAGLISITIGGAVVPVALRLANGSRAGTGIPLPVTIALSSLMGATILANQFGFDGSAYGAHLLVGVPGRTELRARATALGIILVPVLVLILAAVALFSADAAALIPGLGAIGAAFGASMASASVISVLVAYPVPESRNAFASSSGSGSAKGILSLVGMLGAALLAAPILIAVVLLPGASADLMAPIGIGWGLAAVLLVTRVIGGVLSRRGPELLVAVTPRR
jgi:ABC-2 type transport system permease protein